MSLPLVSISIITYNQISFIHETLESAVNQDYDNLEVVVADDGSTDGTSEVIIEYSKKYPNRLISLTGGPNLGVTGNSNRALRSCKGKYIAFQGGDDVLLPGKIKAQVEWFEENRDRVLCGHAIDIIQEPSGNLIRRQSSRHIGVGPKKFIECGNLFGATSVMVKKNALPKHGFREELPWVSDTMLWIETLMLGGSFGFVDGVYALYKKHSSNVTNNHSMCMPDIVEMYNIIAKEYPAWKQSCSIGRARKIYYSQGIRAMKANDYILAMDNFRLAFQCYPLDVKTWYRFISCWKKCFI